VAKTRDGSYLPGRRSDAWIKVKVRQTMECQVLGYTSGKGDRQSHFGALHLGVSNGENGGIKYLGKVGSGFDDKLLKSIHSQLKKVKETKRQIDQKPADDAETTWIEPNLICEVQFASLTNMGTLREAVFLRMRPDL
jgi:bifunctional non-homologous end joining protein LigD